MAQGSDVPMKARGRPLPWHRMPAILGQQGALRAGAEGGGASGEGGEQHWSCGFTSLSHTSVESVFSQSVRFVTSHLSQGEITSLTPFVQPWLFLQCSRLGGIPSNWGPVTPAHQRYHFAPGKGVV